ncbi:superfamily II DNA or RNA helicase/integrase [Roseovarius sp. MBR-38]
MVLQTKKLRVSVSQPVNQNPEQIARDQIDRRLEAAGWQVQDKASLNPNAALGVAVREYPTDTGPADYVLFVDARAVGVVEAKPDSWGERLTIVEEQSSGYAAARLKWVNNNEPLPFIYESTSVVTRFTDGRDPAPRSREVFTFHRPETLKAWVNAPLSLRAGLQNLPDLNADGLRDCQIKAITKLESSLQMGKPRALVQMATGSGKTFTAITQIYRLLKHAGAWRILFLVDTKNLGEQAEGEFMAYLPNDDNRKFTELYNVQRLTSPSMAGDTQVVISTIQRMYATLKGEPLDEAAEEDHPEEQKWQRKQPLPVVYNPKLPPETFDVVVIDECHRSIYNLWRQVIEYFDAFLIGLTATPDARTYGFFQQNVVSEYTHENAVADKVNVGNEVFLIETEMSKGGGSVKAQQVVEKRERQTRARRWETQDDELKYAATQLDRSVVAPDQIRTVIATYRDAWPKIFPGRKEVPKTLIFAKTDSHADDIIQMVRTEFGQGNEFCRKITNGAKNPKSTLAAFRNEFYGTAFAPTAPVPLMSAMVAAAATQAAVPLAEIMRGAPSAPASAVTPSGKDETVEFTTDTHARRTDGSTSGNPCAAHHHCAADAPAMPLQPAPVAATRSDATTDMQKASTSVPASDPYGAQVYEAAGWTGLDADTARRVEMRPPRLENIDLRVLSEKSRKALEKPRGIALEEAIDLFCELKCVGYGSDFTREQVADPAAGKKWERDNGSKPKFARSFWPEFLGTGAVEQIAKNDLRDALALLPRIPAKHGKGQAKYLADHGYQELVERIDSEEESDTVANLEALAARTTVTEADREDARRKALQKRLRSETQIKHRRFLLSVGTMCMELQLADKNPFEILSVSNDDKKRMAASEEKRARTVWDDRIYTLFSSPVFQGEIDEPGEPLFWLPLFGRLMGLREEEGAQLSPGDFGSDRGIQFLDIKCTDANHIKTEESQRRIPIHPQLLELVEMRRRQGQSRLFPHMTRGRTKGKFSENFSKTRNFPMTFPTTTSARRTLR